MTESDKPDPTFLRKRGVRKRMRCSGQAAHRIEDTFVTVEQLVAAVESDQDLTEYDGIGPKTAEVINDWWDHRFEIEEKMDSSSVERTGSKTATIHFHNSWSGVLKKHRGGAAMTRSSYSGRTGWECDCGRVVSVYDREYHRRNECPIRSKTGREEFQDRLSVECFPKLKDRTLARETPTEEIKVTDPETETEEFYEVSNFAQGMARHHLRDKAIEWFTEDYYERLVDTDAHEEGQR